MTDNEHLDIVRSTITRPDPVKAKLLEALKSSVNLNVHLGAGDGWSKIQQYRNTIAEAEKEME